MKKGIVAFCFFAFLSTQVVRADEFATANLSLSGGECDVIQTLHDETAKTLSQIHLEEDAIKSVEAQLKTTKGNAWGGGVLFVLGGYVLYQSRGALQFESIFHVFGAMGGIAMAGVGGVEFVISMKKIPELKKALVSHKAELVRAKKNYTEQNAALAEAIRDCKTL